MEQKKRTKVLDNENNSAASEGKKKADRGGHIHSFVQGIRALHDRWELIVIMSTP